MKDGWIPTVRAGLALRALGLTPLDRWADLDAPGSVRLVLGRIEDVLESAEWRSSPSRVLEGRDSDLPRCLPAEDLLAGVHVIPGGLSGLLGRLGYDPLGCVRVDFFSLGPDWLAWTCALRVVQALEEYDAYLRGPHATRLAAADRSEPKWWRAPMKELLQFTEPAHAAAWTLLDRVPGFSDLLRADFDGLTAPAILADAGDRSADAVVMLLRGSPAYRDLRAETEAGAISPPEGMKRAASAIAVLADMPETTRELAQILARMPRSLDSEA